MAKDDVGIDGLIFYVDDLENLVRWFALMFTYEDPNTGEKVTNDPIWSITDAQGQPLPDNVRLKRTWDRVMHPEGDHVSRETLPAGAHEATPYASPAAGRDLVPGEDPPM